MKFFPESRWGKAILARGRKFIISQKINRSLSSGYESASWGIHFSSFSRLETDLIRRKELTFTFSLTPNPEKI
jgi:hypothetical protein